jgi:hypothetical protein
VSKEEPDDDKILHYPNQPTHACPVEAVPQKKEEIEDAGSGRGRGLAVLMPQKK